ncbi:MAG: hypothetical protein JWO36_5730 [Myxococcales bacterium]|nr:hypothetical protein [Myxococcales bacterium]
MDQSNPPPGSPGSLALHLRRLRKLYGNEGLTQEELAALADVSERTIRDYETVTRLPYFVEPLVRVALALQVPFERLVAPALLDALRDDVERRRITLEQAADFSHATKRDPG